MDYDDIENSRFAIWFFYICHDNHEFSVIVSYLKSRGSSKTKRRKTRGISHNYVTIEDEYVTTKENRNETNKLQNSPNNQGNKDTYSQNSNSSSNSEKNQVDIENFEINNSTNTPASLEDSPSKVSTVDSSVMSSVFSSDDEDANSNETSGMYNKDSNISSSLVQTSCHGSEGISSVTKESYEKLRSKSACGYRDEDDTMTNILKERRSLTISGSLNHSENSVFQIVPQRRSPSKNSEVLSCSENIHSQVTEDIELNDSDVDNRNVPKLDKIIGVIEQDKNTTIKNLGQLKGLERKEDKCSDENHVENSAENAVFSDGSEHIENSTDIASSDEHLTPSVVDPIFAADENLLIDSISSEIDGKDKLIESFDLSFTCTTLENASISHISNSPKRTVNKSPNSVSRSSSKSNDLSHSQETSVTSSVEENYRNQETAFGESISDSKGGSAELANVLNDDEVSIHNDYYVPGIHTVSDMTPRQLKRSNTVPASNESDSARAFITRSYTHNSPMLTQNSINLSLGQIRASSNPGSLMSEDSNSDTCSTSDQSFSLLADLGVTDDFIGLKEDHFSSPDVSFRKNSDFSREIPVPSCKEKNWIIILNIFSPVQNHQCKY